MRVCVLSDPEWGDPFDPSYYLQGYEWELHDLHRPHVKEELTALAQQGFDIFLNMCDGAADEDRPGLDVVLALEELNLPFTGAASHYYEPTREQMKSVCEAYGVRAPQGIALTNTDNLKAKVKRLCFPLIVKHPNSYGSIGLLKESRVTCFEELQIQVKRMLDLFGGALVEEFIEGSEFSVLVSENPDDPENPITYVPVDIIFPSGESFKHTDMKWYRYEELQCNPVTEPGLSGRLRDMAAKLFRGLDGTGYGRCDIRMDAQGELYMLEINPQGAIFYPPEAPGMADSILRFDPRGHAGFVDLLFRAALARHKLKNEVVQSSLTWTDESHVTES
jgi:D-alanine-D-alanine ligase-like ATP-grasp enzyme